MNTYFQNLFQMLRVIYNVWHRPQAINNKGSMNSLVVGDKFNRKIGRKKTDLLELEKVLISKIEIQKKAIVCFEVQGLSLPIFLN